MGAIEGIEAVGCIHVGNYICDYLVLVESRCALLHAVMIY